MSGQIRQQIGLAKGRLQGYLDAQTESILPLVEPTSSLEDNLQEMKQKRRNLMQEREKLQRTVHRLEKLNREWNDLILGLEDQEEEQERYDNVANGQQGFLEQVELAEERTAVISAWLGEIEMEIHSLLLQSAMEDRPTTHQSPANANGRMSDVQVGLPNTVSDNCFVRLPQLQISPFDGNILKFPEFYEAFENSIHKSNLAPVLKFTHLRTLLKGRALEAIEGISITNDNYELALRILQEKFGDKEVLKEKLYGQLRNITPVKSGKLIELRSFVDNLEKILRQLDTLNEQVEHPSIVSLIRNKLPNHLLIKLEENNSQDNVPWTVKRLQEDIAKVVKIQERAFQMSNLSLEGDQYGGIQSKFTQPRVGSSDSKKLTSTFVVAQQGSKNFQGFRKPHCPLCEGTHYGDECHTYKSLDSRKSRLRELKRCFLCLRQNCFARQCKQPKRTCFHCGQEGQHTRLLCPKKFGSIREVYAKGERASAWKPAQGLQQGSSIKSNAPKFGDAWGVYTNKSNCIVGSVRHMVAQAEAINPENGNRRQACIFLDGGSDRTFVTNKFARSMGLSERATERLSVMTFGHSQALEIDSKLVNLQLSLIDGSKLDVVANEVPLLTGTLQQQPLGDEDREKLREMSDNIMLADESPMSKPQTVAPDILIGIEYYHKIVRGGPIKELPSGLYLVPTQLGFIVSGKIKVRVQACIEQAQSEVEIRTGTEVNNQKESLPKPPDYPDISEFWSLESIGIRDDPTNKDDEIAMQQFEKTVFFSRGRYVVSWPWKVERAELQNNYPLAEGRFRHLKGRLERDKDLLEKYNKVIVDQIEQNIIEPADKPLSKSIHYIPHHPVLTPDKSTTKIRVVYDASAKPSEAMKSLNECLYKGPTLMPDLVGLLLRFRCRKIALCSDIEKAFLQLLLHPLDRDTTRFLWFQDFYEPRLNNLKIFRFARVPFGVISSPFLLNATLQHHLKLLKEASKGDDERVLLSNLAQNLYVDNLITGASSPLEAKNVYRGARRAFELASMNLREWYSNSVELMEIIPENLKISTNPVKVLGITWDYKQDNISISTFKPGKPGITKRHILAQISGVFDPMGLFSPAILQGKLFLKELWLLGVDWDDSIGEDNLKKWFPIHDSLSKANEVEISRFLGLEPISSTGATNELVAFVDASSSAYACCIYLKTRIIDHDPVVNLVFSKTKLAGKNLTIPRLELLAILIGCRALMYVKHELHVEIKSMVLFSDSKCALAWVETGKALNTFVRNRVTEINSYIDIQLRYVTGSSNPADIASRGAMISELIDNVSWWKGPEWLLRNSPELESFESPAPDVEEMEQIEKELKKGTISSIVIDMNERSFIEIDRFSSLTRLLNTTVYVLRFIKGHILGNRPKENNHILGFSKLETWL
ncbi:MAG: DUF1759 domain-containing protein, partial [Cytophagales bacterium]|nr:DUF1759 domain-containing protein [Cytophagales bacterium]